MERWQQEFRQQFPVVNQCIYLDNAYDCSGPSWGTAAAEQYFKDWQYAALHNQRGGPGRAALFQKLDEARELLAKLVGAENPDQIAFTRNTNEGINAILQGFDFHPGDNIVTDGQEHESVLMPCLNAARTRGIEVRVLPVREDGQVPAQELMRLADGHTRMVLVSHVQSATGYCIDLESLGSWCHSRNIFLVVDAIQSLGLRPFEMEKWQVDAVSAATYKGLCGVNSTAFTCYRRELLTHIWPVYTAAGPYMSLIREPGNFHIQCREVTKARKMENSSLDNLSVYVLRESLTRLLGIGIDRIWDHVNGLYDRLYQGMESLDFELVTPRQQERHCGILSLRTECLQEMFDYFRSKNVCLSVSAGTFIRFSLGAFNTEADIDEVLKLAAGCPVR